MAKQITDKEADAFLRQVKLLIGGLVVLFMLPLVIYAVYLEWRFEAVQNQLALSPPEELEAEETDLGSGVQLAANPVAGQVVYVPAYSHVYQSDGKPYLLTITLSVRNTSMESEIVVKSVRYFDTKGKEVKSYLNKPVRLPALGTTEVLIKRDDVSGGSGANFLVEWSAKQPVTEPIIEAVMIDTDSQQGISFVRRGSVISEVVAPPETFHR